MKPLAKPRSILSDLIPAVLIADTLICVVMAGINGALS